MFDYFAVQSTTENATVLTLVYTLLISFALSSAIAYTYEMTFRGLSYSRNFIQALILSSIVTSTIMQAIGDSLAHGIGIIGALTIVRFRTNYKDSRDIIFMFSALGVGIATGVYAYSIAIVGGIGFCLVAFALYYSPFGQSNNYDGVLRFNINDDQDSKSKLESILRINCNKFALLTLKDLNQSKKLDFAYHIKLKRNVSKENFLTELKKIDGIGSLSLLLQETTIEL
ncbi:MAG: DUF4956 domain-containing protein [Candidatus Delongbacteria bacterium]|nr:DUF4956 domain-containing protein [Candidatus Delongbacteria bacterium]MBN2833566.1 DUF4956 domain-containing protein [Candidatus Delongbacteria bacterium]